MFLLVYVPEKLFLVVFDFSGQFQFEMSFCFSSCISVHPGNALVLLNGYSSTSPSLVRFAFGFEQTQKLAVKPRGALAPPTSLTFKGNELFLCFQEQVLEKLPALTSSLILHGCFPQNPSQLSSEQAGIWSSKTEDRPLKQEKILILNSF